jgi:ketosteroid isomerase-like protein
MAGEENIERAKKAYEAFINGDAEGAMADMSDDIEWIQPGNSAIGGTYHGKQEVGGLWSKFQEKGLKITMQYWYSDDERVVLLNHVEMGGEEADGVDVLTYRDGKLVKFQTAADTALLERVYGSA